jgi:hypothetical protein
MDSPNGELALELDSTQESPLSLKGGRLALLQAPFWHLTGQGSYALLGTHFDPRKAHFCLARLAKLRIEPNSTKSCITHVTKGAAP